MGEIAAVEPNGYSFVSTFSGAGGASLGYKMVGFKGLMASEFVPAAREVYALNFPEVPIDERDIRELTADDIRSVAGDEVDVLEGSPPCAAFSTAGRQEAGWGKIRHYSDVAQRVDDLFFEFTRLVKDLQPRMFVAENVAGLTRGPAKGYFKLIHQALQDAGYVVEARMLDAQWLGVPQSRRRVFFVGARNDLGVAPRWVKPLGYRYTVRDAIADIPDAPWVGEGPDMDGTAIGREYSQFPEGGKSDRYFSLVRADRDKPSPCVTASGGGKFVAAVAHPTEPRKFQINELKRICAFPDDFQLTGKFAAQWERLGRAVPPLMGAAVALGVQDALCEADGRPRPDGLDDGEWHRRLIG